MSNSPSAKKKAVFVLVTLVCGAVFLELFTTFALVLRMRVAGNEVFTRDEPTYFSLINVPYKAALELGLVKPVAGRVRYRFESSPNPFVAEDATLGYKPLPGKYVHSYLRKRGAADWERLRINYTVNADGTRWTGDCPRPGARNVHVFGDSFAAGDGVNDEQTFAFLLQSARNDLCVRLHAVGGYGTVHAFLQFRQVRDLIAPGDIVVLGYADFLDVRNVVAPSRLRELEEWGRLREDKPVDPFKLPKASVEGNGAISIAYVEPRCDRNEGYCARADMAPAEMTRVTAALINQIAGATQAPVYLLHYSGSPKNPIFGLLGDKVRRISALPRDFDYFISDDIAGFDPHPGPYWHYAMSRKLAESLR
jgi:hypothetical protein